MRLLIAVLVVLLIALQYKLWFGEGGYMDVRRLEQELAEQREANERLRSRNRALQAEVEDLKQGIEAIEERAREDLGMIRDGETFYQVVPPESESATTASGDERQSDN